MRIENWSVCWSTDADAGYTAPEIRKKYLQGSVFGHRRHPDGEHVKTSHLVKLDLQARVAETSSGSTYELGKPNPQYVTEMARLGRVIG